MNIGNQPAFPVTSSVETEIYPPAPGMTYRQWLIGMLASGEAASGNISEVGWLLRRADAIIAAQEMEQPCECHQPK